jgi:hypothetical protein
VHSLSAPHARQALLLVLHTGVVPLQVVSSVHWTQAPAFVPEVAQAGVAVFFAAHWLDAVQAVHAFLSEQMGVLPEQAESARHCTHWLALVSQNGVAPEQSLSTEHCTHWPTFAPVVAQAGVAALFAAHWAAEVHAWHVLDVEQIGVPPAHAVSPRHAAHLFVVLSQKGVLPEQSPSAEHCTH